jgi:hypothetical protein
MTHDQGNILFASRILQQCNWLANRLNWVWYQQMYYPHGTNFSTIPIINRRWTELPEISLFPWEFAVNSLNYPLKAHPTKFLHNEKAKFPHFSKPGDLSNALSPISARGQQGSSESPASKGGRRRTRPRNARNSAGEGVEMLTWRWRGGCRPPGPWGALSAGAAAPARPAAPPWDAPSPRTRILGTRRQSLA